VRGLIADALASFKPDGMAREIVVKGLGEPRTVKGHPHPLLAKVLKLAAQRANIMLVGPAGCGKSKLCEMAAEALGLTFSANSVSAGMSEGALAGYLLPVEDGGKFVYVPVGFVRAYENGGLHLLDELDAGDANVLTFINNALSNGGFFIPQRHEQPYVKRHPDFVCIAAANTFGSGADAMYVGRNQLDAATLDRFYILPMGYDSALEQGLAPAAVVDWVRGVRAKAEAAKLRRVVGTRMIQRIAAALAAGIPLAEAKADQLASWTRDERAKVGE